MSLLMAPRILNGRWMVETREVDDQVMNVVVMGVMVTDKMMDAVWPSASVITMNNPISEVAISVQKRNVSVLTISPRCGHVHPVSSLVNPTKRTVSYWSVALSPLAKRNETKRDLLVKWSIIK